MAVLTAWGQRNAGAKYAHIISVRANDGFMEPHPVHWPTMRVLNPAVDASRRPFARMPMALTGSGRQRASGHRAGRHRVGGKALQIGAAGGDRPCRRDRTRRNGARWKRYLRPGAHHSPSASRSTPLPREEAVLAPIAPPASTVPATRTACPTVKSPIRVISPPASRSLLNARLAAESRPAPVMALPPMSRSVSIWLAVRETRHCDPLEPAAIDGQMIEAAQCCERAHGRGAAKGRLEGAHVMIEGGLRSAGTGYRAGPGRGVRRQ